MSHFNCALKYMLSIAVLLFAVQSKAATFTYSGDQLTGVNGVEALGGTWDVTFHIGTFNEVDAVYGLSLPFTFTDLESQALSVGLITAMSPLDGILEPTDVNGCIYFSGCAIVTPYTFMDYDGDTVYERVRGFSVGVNENLGVFSIAYQPDITTAVRDIDFDHISYAVWEVSAVPVPAAVWLFGSGLIGLAGFARRKKV